MTEDLDSDDAAAEPTVTHYQRAVQEYTEKIDAVHNSLKAQLA